MNQYKITRAVETKLAKFIEGQIINQEVYEEMGEAQYFAKLLGDDGVVIVDEKGDVTDNELEGLRDEYKALFGKDAHHKMGKESITAKIEEKKAEMLQQELKPKVEAVPAAEAVTE